MSILHTLNTSPFQTHTLQQCLALIGEEDELLLIEDGVVAAQAKHPMFAQLSLFSEQGRLYVLTPDLDARGITNIIGRQCSYHDFVELVAKHQSQLAW